jgi:hypothetical protein
LALPISFDKMGMRKAAVFPEPVNTSEQSFLNVRKIPHELTSLGTGQQIVSLVNGRNTVPLNRSWQLVLAELDVLKHDRMNTGISELGRKRS